MAKKLRPGQARVQFLACRADVFDLIKKGHSIKSIHETLFENAKITMTYSSLIKFLKNFEQSEYEKDKTSQINIIEETKQYNVKVLAASANNMNNEQFGKLKVDTKNLF